MRASERERGCFKNMLMISARVHRKRERDRPIQGREEGGRKGERGGGRERERATPLRSLLLPGGGSAVLCPPVSSWVGREEEATPLAQLAAITVAYNEGCGAFTTGMPLVLSPRVFKIPGLLRVLVPIIAWISVKDPPDQVNSGRSLRDKVRNEVLAGVSETTSLVRVASTSLISWTCVCLCVYVCSVNLSLSLSFSLSLSHSLSFSFSLSLSLFLSRSLARSLSLSHSLSLSVFSVPRSARRKGRVGMLV